MSMEMQDLQPVVEGIFTLPPYEDAPPVLLGGYCPACNRTYFPRPTFCRSCPGHPEEVSLGREGTLYSYTIIRVKPPLGLPAPYAVGYIDLKENGLRVFCLLDPAEVDALEIGLPVVLKVAPLGRGVDGAPRLRPYFTPVLQGRQGREK